MWGLPLQNGRGTTRPRIALRLAMNHSSAGKTGGGGGRLCSNMDRPSSRYVQVLSARSASASLHNSESGSSTLRSAVGRHPRPRLSGAAVAGWAVSSTVPDESEVSSAVVLSGVFETFVP